MYKLSKNSIDRLKAVDVRLTVLVATYLAMNKKDIGVTYGARTQKEQDKLLSKGNSQVKRSKHLLSKETLTTQGGDKIEVLESNAIDIVVYENGKPVWARSAYKEVIKDMKKIVKQFGWADVFNWGWDFKSINDPYHISVKEPGDGGIK